MKEESESSFYLGNLQRTLFFPAPIVGKVVIEDVNLLFILLGRIRDISSRKILDDATRKRRQKRHLEALEKDNFQEDPHSHLTVVPAKMKVPAFNDTMEGNNLLWRLQKRKLQSETHY